MVNIFPRLATQNFKIVPHDFDPWCHSCVYVIGWKLSSESNLRHPSKAVYFPLMVRWCSVMWSIRIDLWFGKGGIMWEANTKGPKVFRWCPMLKVDSKRLCLYGYKKSGIPPTIWQFEWTALDVSTSQLISWFSFVVFQELSQVQLRLELQKCGPTMALSL